MVQAGVRKILNDVIDGDSIIDYYNIGAHANMYPGAVVKTENTDYDIDVCDASGNATGFLGYGNCNGSFKPDTRDTLYATDDNAPVHSGGGFYVRAICSSEAFAKGAELSAGANGIVTAANIGVAPIIGKAAETVADSVDRVWILSYL